MYNVSQKQYTSPLIITSTNVDRYTKFFHCQIPEEIQYTYVTNIVYLTLSIIVHYLVHLKITTAADFNGLLHETSEFILQAIMPL